jgi:hypothetical protein
LYEQVWDRSSKSVSFLEGITVSGISQIYQVIEAQTTSRSWISRNPLWLFSLAQQSFWNPENNQTTNIHKRIDYYRRSLKCEKDALKMKTNTASEVENEEIGFFEIKNSLARDLLRTGNWILALQLR